MRISIILVGLAAFGLAGSARAEDAKPEPIQPDRPGIADGSTVVGPGVFQAEVGVQKEYRSGKKSDERTLYVPALFRYGIDKRWEARIESNTYTEDRSFTPASGVHNATGYQPVSFGFKYHIQDPKEGTSRPSLGTIFRVFVPSGSSDFRSKRVTGDLRLTADLDLGPKWSLNPNVGIALYEDDSGSTFGTGLAAATLTYEVNKNLHPFLDLGLQGPERAKGGIALLFDGGVMFLLDRNTQLDFGIGPGLAGKNVPDLFWTAGISRRFK